MQQPRPKSEKRHANEHGTPIRCERCGGSAHLVSRQAIGDGHELPLREMRDFE